METKWTAELGEDLQAFARVAALAPITPDAVRWAGYSLHARADEEGFQPPVDRTEGETDDGYDAETLRLFGDPWPQTGLAPAPVVRVERYLAASWPGLKAKVVGFVRRWPSHAPLLG